MRLAPLAVENAAGAKRAVHLARNRSLKAVARQSTWRGLRPQTVERGSLIGDPRQHRTGGFTNASSTMSVLVAKTRGLIVIVVVAVTACPPETPSNDTTYGPAFVSRSIRAVPAISGCRDGRPRHRDRMHAREALRTARACSP